MGGVVNQGEVHALFCALPRQGHITDNLLSVQQGAQNPKEERKDHKECASCREAQ
jgi:hypothetical protein